MLFWIFLLKQYLPRFNKNLASKSTAKRKEAIKNRDLVLNLRPHTIYKRHKESFVQNHKSFPRNTIRGGHMPRLAITSPNIFFWRSFPYHTIHPHRLEPVERSFWRLADKSSPSSSRKKSGFEFYSTIHFRLMPPSPYFPRFVYYFLYIVFGVQVQLRFLLGGGWFWFLRNLFEVCLAF